MSLKKLACFGHLVILYKSDWNMIKFPVHHSPSYTHDIWWCWQLYHQTLSIPTCNTSVLASNILQCTEWYIIFKWCTHLIEPYNIQYRYTTALVHVYVSNYFIWVSAWSVLNYLLRPLGFGKLGSTYLQHINNCQRENAQINIRIKSDKLLTRYLLLWYNLHLCIMIFKNVPLISFCSSSLLFLIDFLLAPK